MEVKIFERTNQPVAARRKSLAS